MVKMIGAYVCDLKGQNTFDAQQEIIRKYFLAKKSTDTIIFFIEENFENFIDRKGLASFFSHCEEGVIDKVVVYKLEMFGKTPKTINHVIDKFRHYNIQIVEVFGDFIVSFDYVFDRIDIESNNKRGPKFKKIDTDLALFFVNERNLSVTKTAKRFNVSPSTLSLRLRNEGYRLNEKRKLVKVI